MVSTLKRNQWLSCVRLAPFTALHARYLAVPTGYWKSTIHSDACLGSNSSTSCCFIPLQPCCKTDRWDAEYKKDGQKQRGRQMGRLYLSSRPPNGHPPRSCVIYARRALALFFSVSADGSDDLLEGMLSASKTSQGGNKSSPG